MYPTQLMFPCAVLIWKFEPWSSILTWHRRYRDPLGGSPRARPFHCTSDGLTLAIAPNVGDSGAQFLLVGDCVRAIPWFWTIFALSCLLFHFMLSHNLHVISQSPCHITISMSYHNLHVISQSAWHIKITMLYKTTKLYNFTITISW